MSAGTHEGTFRAPGVTRPELRKDLLALLSVAYGNQRGVIEEQRSRMDRRCRAPSLRHPLRWVVQHGEKPAVRGGFFNFVFGCQWLEAELI